MACACPLTATPTSDRPAHVASATTRLIPHELTSDDLRLTDFIVE
jgi:hypothetical protein